MMRKTIFRKTEYLAPESEMECTVAGTILSTSPAQDNENYDSSVFDWGEAGYDVQD